MQGRHAAKAISPGSKPHKQQGKRNMKLLVVYASRYGATREIAERIAEVLTAHGLDAMPRPAGNATDLADYDGCIIGSAIYFGKWRREAINFTERNKKALAATNAVWLFSSGPLGIPASDPDRTKRLAAAEPRVIHRIKQQTGAREHKLFFGALHRKKLGLAHRLLATLPASREWAEDGDFREWDEINNWAKSIGTALTGSDRSQA